MIGGLKLGKFQSKEDCVREKETARETEEVGVGKTKSSGTREI